MKSLGVRRESVDETTFAQGPYPLDDPKVQELAASIRKHGLLQPYGRSTEGVGIWGRRRWTAVKFVLEKKEELTHTCEVEPGEEEILRDVENAVRSDLSPMEKEIALARLANRYKVADAVEQVQSDAHDDAVATLAPAAEPKGGRGKKGAAAKAAEAAGVDRRTAQLAVANVEALSAVEQKALSKAKATHAQIRDAAKLTGMARAALIAGLLKAAKKGERVAAAVEVEVPRDETGTDERLGNVLPPHVEAIFRPTLKACDALLDQLTKARSESEKVGDAWKKHTQPMMQKLNGRWSALLVNTPNLAAAVGRVASHVVPDLGDVIAKVRKARPYALCPRCKGRPAAMVSGGKIKGHKFGGMAECGYCNQFGFVDEDRYSKMAEAFRVYEPIVGSDGEQMQPMVWVSNHAVKVTDLEEIAA